MWDNLEIRRSKQLAVLMYKTIYKSTPNYLTRIFENINSVHSHVRNSGYHAYQSEDHILRLVRTAFIIKVRFSGIVYQTNEKVSLTKRILCNSVLNFAFLIFTTIFFCAI